MSTGAGKSIGSYKYAAWSPDGKWIAAFGGGKLVLLDANLRRVRVLGKAYEEHPQWSPDSRYLLVGWPRCGAYFFSFSALDIDTGKRTEIKSSHCKATTQGYWWVGDDVYQALTRASSSER